MTGRRELAWAVALWAVVTALLLTLCMRGIGS